MCSYCGCTCPLRANSADSKPSRVPDSLHTSPRAFAVPSHISSVQRLFSERSSQHFCTFSLPNTCVRAGRAVIAAYGQSARFFALQEQLTDDFLVCSWATLAANRFLGLTVDAISYVVVAGAAVFSVYGRDNGTPLGPAAASLALIYAMQVSYSNPKNIAPLNPQAL